MIDPAFIPVAELQKLVRKLQIVLWLDERTNADGETEEFWNPDKEWDSSTVDSIEKELRDSKLGPTEEEALQEEPS